MIKPTNQSFSQKKTWRPQRGYSALHNRGFMNRSHVPSCLLLMMLSGISFARADDAKLTPRTIEGHTASIMSLAYSPDGTVLASSSRDGTVKLWKARDGALIKSLPAHEGTVYCVN